MACTAGASAIRVLPHYREEMFKRDQKVGRVVFVSTPLILQLNSGHLVELLSNADSAPEAFGVAH
jgi:hypothetical protein